MTPPKSKKTFAEFQQLVDAEEYLEFFGISYDPQFVNVNRLHILKQFSLLIEKIDRVFPDLNETERLEKYGEALAEAYEVFRTNSPLDMKLFKVFQEQHSGVVLLKDVGNQEGS